MTPQEWTNSPAPRQPGDDEAIDIEKLIQAIWRHRWWVVLATIAGGLLGYGASVMGTRYLSSGLLLTPEVQIGDFKRYEAAMNNPTRMERFLEASGKSAEPVARVMRALVDEPGALAEAVRPEFSFTDRDAKQFGIKMADAGELVGIDLTLRQKQPDMQAPVLLLAEYVRETAISVDLESTILKGCLDNEVREQELRNEQLEGEFQVAQLEDRAARLREIIARLPASAVEVRQVVSIENGGDRFLPPATQLASTEIRIADLRVDEVKRKREQAAAEIRKAYYCEARKMQAEGGSGRDLLLSLPGLRQQVMTGRDLSVNVVEQTANALELQSRQWSNRYLSRVRFVASPLGAQMLERRPGRLTGVALGLAIGALLGMVLAVMLSWWGQHRDEIVR
jgi:LPS O-antigen subunit length determinant protein (WzzB/FepE family)